MIQDVFSYKQSTLSYQCPFNTYLKDKIDFQVRNKISKRNLSMLLATKIKVQGNNCIQYIDIRIIKYMHRELQTCMFKSAYK